MYAILIPSTIKKIYKKHLLFSTLISTDYSMNIYKSQAVQKGEVTVTGDIYFEATCQKRCR